MTMAFSSGNIQLVEQEILLDKTSVITSFVS